MSDHFNYEHFGYSIPKKFEDQHIGLYQPMLNRFLLIVCDIQHAQDIALIASGRYPLFLVNLATADNYCENLLDNLCCEQWALPVQQIIPTTIANYANVVVNAEHLVACQADPDLLEQKQYLQMCWHYLKLLDQIIDKNIAGWRIKQFMSDIFDLKENQHDTLVQNLKKQVIAELYLCKDINLVRDSIENTIVKAKKEYDLVF